MAWPAAAAAILAIVVAGCANAAPRSDDGYRADIHVHDPTMIEANGTYYLFGTGDGIEVHSSKDLKTWKAEPRVFASPPAWTHAIVPDYQGSMWAPDISFHHGRYYLYYSVSAIGKNTSAIGLVTNKTLDPASPDYHWVDHGPVIRSIPYRDLWNAIDPNLALDDDGTPYLVFGSFWGGVKMFRLDAALDAPAEPQQWYTLAKRERDIFVDDAEPEPAAIEAPFIFHHNGWYYLFVSWDYCCRGIDSTYKIVVGRSRSITGPYVDRSGKEMAQGGGTIVLKGNANYPGVGHNSAYTFGGQDYLVFHAYDEHDHGQSKLKVTPMHWDHDGWPLIDPHVLD
ncbi:arabinan endo-1,5-alpha-L-arabinosidase [Solimonas sp. C16B3]|uniref:Extracellular exo-alpha-(1->5)-L-arabinofuranosidase n=2 Tax=Solimonas marina TaxID=2714601 RepID=A0A969WBA4_9GAMM|nr:arabinan endo-1,5-alpha-L-arabinosidase [Solimonas marina]